MPDVRELLMDITLKHQAETQASDGSQPVPASPPPPGPPPLAAVPGAQDLTAGQKSEAERKVPLEIEQVVDLPLPIEDDPDEIFEHRFLCKGSTALLIGQTGAGKSSFTMQGCMKWSLGYEHFGLRPAKRIRENGMKICIIQAENDRGDLAEMAQGVIKGLNLRPEQIDWIRPRVLTLNEVDAQKEELVGVCEKVLQAHPGLDLLVIDPAFHYLGGDALKAQDVGHFMRKLMLPLAKKHNVGILIIHHTNKPSTNKDKFGAAAGDYAYLGAGSAEWINPARAGLAIIGTKVKGVFRLKAIKRDRRLRWLDQDGNYTDERYIAYHREASVICWRDADPSEIEEVLASENPESDKVKPGRKKLAVDSIKLLTLILGSGEPQPRSAVHSVLMAKGKCSEGTANTWIKDALKAGLLEIDHLEETKGSANPKQWIKLKQ